MASEEIRCPSGQGVCKQPPLTWGLEAWVAGQGSAPRPRLGGVVDERQERGPHDA